MGLDADIRAAPETPQWPDGSGPFVVLVDASSTLEADLIADWIVASAGSATDPIDVIALPPSRRQRRLSVADLAIGERLSEADDPLCIPVRVAWLANHRHQSNHQ